MVLWKRVLTALCGLPLVLWLVYVGDWWYWAGISLASVLAWGEFCRMLRVRGSRPWQSLGYAYALVLPLCAWQGNAHETLFLLTLLFLLSGARLVVQAQRFKVEDALATVFGVLYVPLLFSFFAALRLTVGGETPGGVSLGAAYVYLAFAGTWASDTCAYFVGSRWGRTKLCPAISPGKTVEGAWGGLLGTLTIVGGAGTFLVGLTPLQALLLAGLIAVAAPIGDLVESCLKRYAGVKDSGALLPGHGGMLDRTDSLLFVVPAVYFYVSACSLFIR